MLSRIEIASGKVENIANVMESGRFPAMGFGPDGMLYGGGGMKGRTALCFDPHSLELELWNDIRDADGERPARIHELCVAGDGTIFLPRMTIMIAQVISGRLSPWNRKQA